MVIVYKLSPLSYWLGRVLIKVKHIGLVNLIADRQIVPELLQSQASPDNNCRYRRPDADRSRRDCRPQNRICPSA